MSDIFSAGGRIALFWEKNQCYLQGNTGCSGLSITVLYSFVCFRKRFMLILLDVKWLFQFCFSSFPVPIPRYIIHNSYISCSYIFEKGVFPFPRQLILHEVIDCVSAPLSCGPFSLRNSFSGFFHILFRFSVWNLLVSDVWYINFGINF